MLFGRGAASDGRVKVDELVKLAIDVLDNLPPEQTPDALAAMQLAAVEIAATREQHAAAEAEAKEKAEAEAKAKAEAEVKAKAEAEAEAKEKAEAEEKAKAEAEAGAQAKMEDEAPSSARARVVFFRSVPTASTDG